MSRPQSPIPYQVSLAAHHLVCHKSLMRKKKTLFVFSEEKISGNLVFFFFLHILIHHNFQQLIVTEQHYCFSKLRTENNIGNMVLFVVKLQHGQFIKNTYTKQKLFASQLRIILITNIIIQFCKIFLIQTQLRFKALQKSISYFVLLHAIFIYNFIIFEYLMLLLKI